MAPVGHFILAGVYNGGLPTRSGSSGGLARFRDPEPRDQSGKMT